MILMSRLTGDAYAPYGARTVYKGGGGTSTTVSGIDEEFKPDLKYGLGMAKELLSEQALDPSKVVASLNQQQKDALTASQTFAEDKIKGTGIYDTAAAEQASLQGLLGNKMGTASAAGNLGSARSQKAMASALAGRAGEYQKQRQEFADTGVQQLGDVGSSLQQQTQAELSAQDTALDRFFGRITGAAPRSTTTTQSGGK
jgi:hypothetical protein